jgi:type IV pilus assembly protein PilW
MLFNPYPPHRSGHGFSLVEIMVAVAVGMLGILIIMQVFLLAEGQKRTTTGGADAQENALMAMYTLERELRIAGLGLVGSNGLDCATVISNRGAAAYNFQTWPVTIVKDTPAAGSDTITLVYSNSGIGSIPTILSAPALNSNVGFTVTNPDGFRVGDLALVSEPGKNCTLTEITSLPPCVPPVPPAPPGMPPLNVCTTGGTYNAAANNFPAGGYTAGSGRLFNMGSMGGPNRNLMVNHQYYVSPDNNLMMLDVNRAVGADNPVALVNGIVSIRAQYGRDTDGDRVVDVYDYNVPTIRTEVVAVRLAVVARSGQMEKLAVSPATLVLWNGGTTANGGAITLDATAQLYRYKTYQTTIPLRNVLWN